MGFLKKLEKNRVGQLVCFLGLEVIILGIYFVGGKWVTEQGEKGRLSTQSVVIDYDILTQIEDVNTEGRDIVFSGWALRLQSKKTELDFVLKEADGTKSLVFDTESFTRDDVEGEFDATWDFGDSGFEVKIPKRKIDDEICYEIQLGFSYAVGSEEKTKKITTNRYLYNGKMYRYNPLTFEEPKTDDKGIIEVVSKGELCAYSAKRNIWIYRYAGKIYWIVDESYIPSLKEASGLPCMLYTHREELISPDKLVVREEGSYEFYDIFMNTSELVEGEITSYFFVSRELPTEYPVTYIKTGNWSNVDSWLYNTSFQVYEFDKE